MEGNFELCPIAWVVEKWFGGQHEIHKKQFEASRFHYVKHLMSTFHLRLKKYSTMGHWYVHTDSRVWSPQWLHHLQFSGFNAFRSAPERSVSWLNWMSLPNKLKRSHTVITLRRKGNLLCMNHNSVYVPCGVCQNGARKKTWYTTDSQIVMFHTSGYILGFFFCFVLFFVLFWKFAQNRRWQCFQNGWMLPLFLLELLSLFYQLEGNVKWSWCLLVTK